jgi:hypothetical protein
MRFKARARPRPTDGPNKTEVAYGNLLELQLRAGEILWYAFEPFKLRLADRTFYTPDYAVINKSLELEFHEVKGFWEDDARVKIKVAAETFRHFRFCAVTKSKAAPSGWECEEF